jgi:hypothetical protein
MMGNMRIYEYENLIDILSDLLLDFIKSDKGEGK